MILRLFDFALMSFFCRIDNICAFDITRFDVFICLFNISHFEQGNTCLERQISLLRDSKSCSGLKGRGERETCGPQINLIVDCLCVEEREREREIEVLASSHIKGGSLRFTIFQFLCTNY